MAKKQSPKEKRFTLPVSGNAGGPTIDIMKAIARLDELEDEELRRKYSTGWTDEAPQTESNDRTKLVSSPPED